MSIGELAYELLNYIVQETGGNIELIEEPSYGGGTRTPEVFARMGFPDKILPPICKFGFNHHNCFVRVSVYSPEWIHIQYEYSPKAPEWVLERRAALQNKLEEMFRKPSFQFGPWTEDGRLAEKIEERLYELDGYDDPVAYGDGFKSKALAKLEMDRFIGTGKPMGIE